MSRKRLITIAMRISARTLVCFVMRLSGDALVLRQIALSSKETSDGNIFIKRFPVEAASGEAHLGALLGSGVQQSRKPS